MGAMLPISAVLAGEGITQQEYSDIAVNPQFQRYVESYCAELKDNGFSIRAKAKILAEDLLADMYHLVRDTDQPAAARVKMFENFANLADVMPKKEAAVTTGPQFGVVINIPSEGLKLVADSSAAANHVVQAPVIELPAAKPKLPSQIIFDEPDSYEYAGEDFCQ